MSSLANFLNSKDLNNFAVPVKEIADFSPAEIRQGIAELVSKGMLSSAMTVSDAALNLYPESEDILAISALLAETQSNWPLAEQLLEQLIATQGSTTSARAWQHLIRVQRCHSDPTKALQSAQRALSAHPNDIDLSRELNELLNLTANRPHLAEL